MHAIHPVSTKHKAQAPKKVRAFLLEPLARVTEGEFYCDLDVYVCVCLNNCTWNRRMTSEEKYLSKIKIVNAGDGVFFIIFDMLVWYTGAEHTNYPAIQSTSYSLNNVTAFYWGSVLFSLFFGVFVCGCFSREKCATSESLKPIQLGVTECRHDRENGQRLDENESDGMSGETSSTRRDCQRAAATYIVR